MANFNRVLLVGNLTRDPQLRYIPSSNTPVVDFGLVNATMHKLDEAVALADLAKLQAIYARILRSALASG